MWKKFSIVFISFILIIAGFLAYFFVKSKGEESALVLGVIWSSLTLLFIVLGIVIISLFLERASSHD